MSRHLAYARLIRLPNVFTAFADVAVGTAVAWAAGHFSLTQLLLFAVSGCLYSAGMVWNDWADVDEDRRERPFRPIPSGAVTRRQAFALGTGLFIVAIVAAGVTGSILPLTLALILALLILFYNFHAKRTVYGPVVMGGCRLLNVLLGFALLNAEVIPWPARVHAAAAVGLHVTGLSLLARRETGGLRRRDIRNASIVMAAGWLLAATVPAHAAAGEPSSFVVPVLVAFALLLARSIGSVVEKSEPSRVGAAVKLAIFGIIILDAALAAGLAGPVGWLTLLFWPPAAWLGRYLYST